ncbi:hypothetical protein LPJ61_003841 [Coemansia biformis]|uniref:Uncharacterized protein n=1 Tax=Coemansia biformis TaxID=1286918 RepID=A0A9W7YBF0_9FUNG|nr:hypothetical protein LPJ61_003841 [Coemansia biformis]
MRPATAKLDPPGQFGLGGCSLSKLAALAASSGRATAPHATRSDKPSRLQESLLSKYSESLGVSRTMMSTSGRAGKPRTMLGWQANVSRANDLRGMDRAAGIVQYEAKEPTDTGISKVVRNQLTTEAGQGDAGRRPAVRRVRQTMSETKVVPLKSIRLRLDESIVGGRTTAGRPQGPPARGPRYMVKGGRIEGHAGQHAPGASLEPTPASGNQVARGTGGQHGRDALGEFGEIQKRLKAAEEQKRQQQKQQLFDKDGGDGVRISDIIESRQNIPLAVQLEERRRMQQAKQLAAMNQQLELQRIDAEAKRMLAEQQQQHEQFRLRSLYPDAGCNRRHSMASAAYSVGRSDWPACASSVGGGEWHTAHDAAYSTNSAAVWQQQQQAVPYSFYSRQHSRAGTPGALGESGGHWAQHQQQPVGGRSQSQFSRAVAPSFQSAGGASHAEDRLASVAARRRPGGMLVKQPRPASQTALTEHSAGSSGSWQSHALRGPPAAMHVGAGSNYERSMATSSPVLNSGTTRRSSSLSHAGIRHPSMGSHQRALPVGGMVPPVPPLPRTHSNGHGHHGGPGSPTQTPPTYGHWARPPLSSWCAQPATAQHMGSPHAHDFVPRDAQNMQQKWAVTAARGPSLLQQLHHAQSSGILPMQRAEKELYTKGAYQNGSTPVPVRGGTGAHYLGDGNTLLIDRVHESQHTRRAFFKKMGCNYADAAPMPVFMQ